MRGITNARAGRIYLRRVVTRCSANGGEVQSASAPETKGSLLDQHRRPAALVACQIQTFGETQHFSQTEWRDTFIASVDPPLIQFKRKTGMSKRTRVREIREKT